MKKLLTIISLIAVVFAFAQKKPNVNKAKAAMEKGDYSFAKSEIDRATEDEKAKTKAKTWFYKGMIYMAMDTSGVDATTTSGAVSAFKKTVELDPEQKQSINYPNWANAQLSAAQIGITNYVDYTMFSYYSFFFNQGIELYQKANENDDPTSYVKASKLFAKSYDVMNDSITSIEYAAYAASLGEDEAGAKTYFKKAADAGSKDKNVYLQLYNTYVQEENYEDALVAIRAGKEIFPNDGDFSKYEINTLIQMDKVDEAKAGLEDAITKDPNNPDLLFTLGVIEEETGNADKAEATYKKALAVDATHYNSNFNLGVLLFNKSQGLIKERNALSYTQQDEYKALSTKIDAQLNDALPIWEKLYELDATDQTVLETLSYIYSNLKMNDKAEKMQNELDAIGG